MKPPRRQDRGVWIVVLSAGLALSSASLLFCPTALARDPATTASAVPPVHAATEASKTALTLQPEEEEGDELLEHWSDPKYANEERLQIAGIVGMFLCAGGATACRTRARRRLEHDA